MKISVFQKKKQKSLCFSQALFFTFLMFFVVSFLSSFSSAFANSRIKDITFVEGLRVNQLLGYGIVVGLDGSGDSTGSGEFTSQTIKALTQRFGIRTDKLNSKNVAAVIVSGSLPAYALPGSKIDVTVSSLGDASSLKGGTLLLTSLLASTGVVYAVAQGKITIPTPPATGAFGGSAIETNGRIASGAIVEQRSGEEEDKDPYIRLSLRTPDFTTSNRISEAINVFMGEVIARSPNPGQVVITKTAAGLKNPVAFMNKLEQLKVETDEVAKVVIDSQSGVVVMGQNVRVSDVAIALDNMTIQIGKNGSADFIDDPRNTEGKGDLAYNIEDEEDDLGGSVFGGGRTSNRLPPHVVSMEQGVSIQSLVRNLNALGISTKDLIRILENIKAQGALHAEIEII